MQLGTARLGPRTDDLDHPMRTWQSEPDDGTGCHRRGNMALTTTPDLNFDPYDIEITANPYPVLRRLREEAPLYYNERYDFYAMSSFADV